MKNQGSKMTSYGIYGYEISIVYELEGYKLVPYYEDLSNIKKLASDPKNYHLTGFLEIDNKEPDVDNLIFNLQSVLSFIDQKNVIIMNRLHEHETYTCLDDGYQKILTTENRRNGGSGKLISSDFISRTSRKEFIVKALKRLDVTCDEAFRNAFFRSVETIRGSGRFVDVDYYLLFSALETLCRFHASDYQTKNVSIPIAKVLIEFGFDISQNNTMDLHKAVSTYAHLRNALFHNSKLECELNLNGQIKMLRLIDYYSQFKRLVPLAIMKSLGFDDGRINWNCWLDRMPFK